MPHLDELPPSCHSYQIHDPAELVDLRGASGGASGCEADGQGVTDSLTADMDEDEWPQCTRYAVFPVARLPPLEPGDLKRSEAARNLACMRGGIPLSVRLGRQLFPLRGARDCCTYHSVDWHRVSAVAIDVARRVPDAPRAWDEDGLGGDTDGEIWEQAWCRIAELLTASALTDTERRFAESLLWPLDGIVLGHIAGQRDLSYTGGMHRAHALLAAGVRRTVIIRSRCCRPDRDCADGKISRTVQDFWA